MRKKATLITVTLLCMLALLTGCSDAAVYTAGTYAAAAEGYGGDITVEVTFDETSILSVKVTEQNETVTIGDRAVEEIPIKIVEAQNAEVDSITGATITSDGIKEAVKDCMEQAGAK